MSHNLPQSSLRECPGPVTQLFVKLEEMMIWERMMDGDWLCSNTKWAALLSIVSIGSWLLGWVHTWHLVWLKQTLVWLHFIWIKCERCHQSPGVVPNMRTETPENEHNIDQKHPSEPKHGMMAQDTTLKRSEFSSIFLVIVSMLAITVWYKRQNRFMYVTDGFLLMFGPLYKFYKLHKLSANAIICTRIQ